MIFCLFFLALFSLPGADLAFEPNLGQGPPQSRYLARDPSGVVLVEDTALQMGTIRLAWMGTSTGVWEAESPARERHHYCRASDPQALCQTGVATWRRLIRRGIYPGIDWVLYQNGEHLEYDLLVHPGADPSQARFTLTGAAASWDAAGSLVTGPVKHRQPLVRQAGRILRSRIRPAGPHSFGFSIEAHDASQPMVIDPVIERARVDGGRGEDRTFGSFGKYRFGTTRSADWSGRSDRDVFVRFEEQGAMTTWFWGGTGEEDLSAAEPLQTDGSVWLAGTTTSRNAPQMVDGVVGAAGGAGAADGFVLFVTPRGLTTASVIGGPGEDRVYGMRFDDPAAFRPRGLVLVGETDNPDWPSSVVTRVGSGGGRDAFAVRWPLDGRRGQLLVVGGSGDDRARGLAWFEDRWVIAGETASSNLPGLAPARDTDLWAAKVRIETGQVESLTLWGGAGRDQLAGVAAMAGEGVYLAGTTESNDLPASRNAYQGQGDGFVARLDPLTLAPLATTYLGGRERDEITSLTEAAGDLYLTGATASHLLEGPGASLDPQGDFDGWFLHADSRAVPMYAHRIGGRGIDRIQSVRVTSELGVVELSGETNDAAWLRGYPAAAGSGGLDGFTLTLRFPVIFAGPNGIAIGRDLQERIPLRVEGEFPADGVLLASVSDPRSLLIAHDRAPAGAPQAALLGGSGFGERAYSPLLLQGLADSGEVEVYLRARVESGFAQRRLIVRLYPSALFFLNRYLPVRTGQRFDFTVFAAPLLGPGGERGPAQAVRTGAFSPFSVSASDLSLGLAPILSDGRFQGQASEDGVFRLTPTSPLIPPAPGQTLTVEASSNPYSPVKAQVAQDHFMELFVQGRAGEELTFTSLDPGSIQVATGFEWSAGLRVTLPANGQATVRWLALRSSGQTGIRMTGTLDGRAVDVVHEVRLVPYTVRVVGFQGRVAVGQDVSFGLEIQPAPRVFDGEFESRRQTLRPDSPLTRVRPRSSDPTVLSPTSQFVLNARRVGEATVDFDRSTGFPEVDQFREKVTVSPPRHGLPAETVTLVSGADSSLALTAPGNQVRVRTSNPAVVSLLNDSGTPTPDWSFDPRFRGLVVRATGRAGETASLVISIAGQPDQTVLVRLGQALLSPTAGDYLVATISPPRQNLFLNFDLRMAGGASAAAQSRFSQPRSATVISTNPAVCKFPATVEVQSSLLQIAAECLVDGETTVRLAADWLAPEQATQTVRVRVYTIPTAPPVLPAVRVGSGLATVLYQAPGTRLRSADPARMLLGVSDQQAGQPELTVPSSGAVWVHGLVAEGVTLLLGGPREIPVYHFPATIALRTSSSSNLSPDASPLILGVPSRVEVSVFPVLVEPSFNLLLALPERFLGGGTTVIRGGTDPFFVPLRSSDETVAAPVLPRVLIREGQTDATFSVNVRATGEATVSAQQPPGFVATQASELRLRVQPRTISVGRVILAPDLQTLVSLFGLIEGAPVTVESLSPDKVLLADRETGEGVAQLMIRPGPAGYAPGIFVQALPATQPGERLRLRISGDGYLPVEAEVSIGRVRLEVSGSAFSHPLFPGTANLRLRIGPALREAIEPNWSGGLRPGAAPLALQVSVDRPDLVDLPQTQVPIVYNLASASFRALLPGNATLSITAPESVDNGAPAVAVRIAAWTVRFEGRNRLAPHLVVNAGALVNPSERPITFSLRAEDPDGALLGTILDALPRDTTLSLTLGPNQRQDIFVQLLNAAPRGLRIRVTAPDFESTVLNLPVDGAFAGFSATGSLVVNRAAASVTVIALLGSGNQTLPLGAIPGPVRFEIRSSNPQAVGGTFLDWSPGEASKTVTLPLLGTGDSLLTLVPPGTLPGLVPRPLVVTVR